MAKQWIGMLCVVATSGCATLTSDSHPQMSFNVAGCEPFSLQCDARNKRESYTFSPPAKLGVRRSDDALHITCTDKAGRRFTESVTSTVSGKIVASAVFLDLGITDAITDMHREYPQSVTIQCHAADPADQPRNSS